MQQTRRKLEAEGQEIKRWQEYRRAVEQHQLVCEIDHSVGGEVCRPDCAVAKYGMLLS